MRAELTELEIIEHYLEGKMDAGERLAFEAQMATDESLREAVQLQKTLTDRLEVIGLKAAIDEAHSAHVTTSGSSTLVKAVGTILTIAITAAVAFWLMSGNENTATEQPLAAQQALQATSATAPGLIEVTQDAAVNEAQSNAGEARQQLTSIPSRLQVPFHSASVNAGTGGEITFPSGSVLHIPPNALVDANGNTLTGDVTIKFREFREAEDMVFCDIPMHFMDEGDSAFFNSAGMFEVRGEQHGESAFVHEERPLRIDFNVTEQLPDANYYALDDETGEWSEIQPATRNDGQVLTQKRYTYDGGTSSETIATDQFGRVTSKVSAVELAEDSVEKVWQEGRGANMEYCMRTTEGRVHRFNAETDYDEMPARLKMVATRWMIVRYRADPSLQDTVARPPGATAEVKDGRVYYTKYRYKNGMVTLDSIGSNPVIFDTIYQRLGPNQTMGQLYDYKNISSLWRNTLTDQYSSQTLQVGGNGTFGLPIATFGIKNVDQRVFFPPCAHVNATFVTPDGESIDNGYKVSVINRSYNAALHYKPDHVVMMRKARNILVILTHDERVFFCNEPNAAKMRLHNPGPYTFKVKDITAHASDQKALKRYLKSH